MDNPTSPAGDLLILGQVVTFLLLICPRQGCYKEQGRHTIAPYLLHHMLMPSAKLIMNNSDRIWQRWPKTTTESWKHGTSEKVCGQQKVSLKENRFIFKRFLERFDTFGDWFKRFSALGLLLFSLLKWLSLSLSLSVLARCVSCLFQEG